MPVKKKAAKKADEEKEALTEARPSASFFLFQPKPGLRSHTEAFPVCVSLTFQFRPKATVLVRR